MGIYIYIKGVYNVHAHIYKMCVYIYTQKKTKTLSTSFPCFVHLSQQERSAGPTRMLGTLFMTLLQGATVF